MKTPFLLLVVIASAVTLAACGGTPPLEEEAQPTVLPTTESESPTIVNLVPTVVAGVVATPTMTAATPTAAAPRATATPTPTPGTPTATATVAPSASLIRIATTVQEKLDTFREAMASGESATVLNIQRDLLAFLPEVEAVAAADKSKAAGAFRQGLRDLRAALGGDLAKLDSAAEGIAAVSGGPTRTQQSGGTKSAVLPITDLARYAGELADHVASFQKAQEVGNVGDLLRLQKTLLDDADRGDAALKTARTPQAQTVRGALEDLRNALGGDSIKFDSALQKLRQVAGSVAGNSAAKTATATRVADLQPLANEVSNQLGAYQRAIEKGNQEEIAKAQKALADKVGKTLEAITSDTSARGAKLREALTAVREVAAGDLSKTDAAKSALDLIVSGQ